MKSTELIKMFKKFNVLTLDCVSSEAGCSIRTVQRQFTSLSAMRSYNKNSRYYTLPDIPKFNRYGIWSYEDIHFSNHGGLRNTVKQLILSSESGLSGNEIGGIVNLSPRSFMNHFRDIEGIFREKHGGVYVYFSNDATTYKRQRIKRTTASAQPEITDADAVQILVGYIKNPDFSAEQLSDFLKSKEKVHVSSSVISKFLSYHGLLKKNPDFRR